MLKGGDAPTATGLGGRIGLCQAGKEGKAFQAKGTTCSKAQRHRGA